MAMEQNQGERKMNNVVSRSMQRPHWVITRLNLLSQADVRLVFPLRLYRRSKRRWSTAWSLRSCGLPLSSAWRTVAGIRAPELPVIRQSVLLLAPRQNLFIRKKH